MAIVNMKLNKAILSSALSVCLAYLAKPMRYAHKLGVNWIGVSPVVLKQNTTNRSKRKENLALITSTLTSISFGELGIM